MLSFFPPTTDVFFFFFFKAFAAAKFSQRFCLNRHFDMTSWNDIDTNSSADTDAESSLVTASPAAPPTEEDPVRAARRSSVCFSIWSARHGSVSAGGSSCAFCVA